MFLGHRVHLKAKTGGDNSMPEKRESLEDAEVPSRKTRVIGRKLHCLNLNLQRWNRTLAATASERSATRGHPFGFAGGHLRLARRWGTTSLKGMNGTPKSRSIRSTPNGTRDGLTGASPMVTESP